MIQSTRWILGAFILVCLSLAVAHAENAFEELETSLAPEEQEMRAASEQIEKLRVQLRANERDAQSPQRTRSIEDIARERTRLEKEVGQQEKRRREAKSRYDDAHLEFFCELSERASGLYAAPPDERIRVRFETWKEQGETACRVFCGKHPTFRFYRSDGDLRSFRLGHIHLMAWAYDYREHFEGNEEREFNAAFPTPPKSITIGYWPFAVIVHPSNPIKSLSLDQLRTFATNRNATWKDLGRAKDGLIRLRICDKYHIAELTTGKSGDAVLSHHQVIRQDYSDMDNLLKDISEDPDALLIWNYTRRIADSGLKLVPILDANGTPLLPSDLPAVASGRYLLRAPLTLLIHPKATKAAKEFSQWLTTAEAAEALHPSRDKSRPADVPFLAHVSLAAKDDPAKRIATAAASTRERAPSPADKPCKSSPANGGPNVSGAVAVMPTEPMSMYFLMAKPAHHAAYEQAVTDALNADGRLKLIDRTQLARVLEEHKREILRSHKASSPAIIAADVFVFSRVASDGAKTYLQIDAIHGPTASLLGDLKLPIDPADPAHFDPPLRQSVAQWWPGVLQGLDDIRSKPIWTLVDVYAGTVELDASADAVRRELESALSRDSRIFFSRKSSALQTQEEMLLRLMGLSRSEGGRFSPAADYLIEARLATRSRIQLRLRGANLAVLDEATLAGSEHAKLHADARQWLAAQVTNRAAKPPVLARPLPAIDSDWAHAQARPEYETGRQLTTKAIQRQDDYDRMSKGLFSQAASLDEAGQHQSMVKATQDVARYVEGAQQHYSRASQLDPTWEDAAYATLISDLANDWRFEKSSIATCRSPNQSMPMNNSSGDFPTRNTLNRSLPGMRGTVWVLPARTQFRAASTSKGHGESTSERASTAAASTSHATRCRENPVATGPIPCQFRIYTGCSTVSTCSILRLKSVRQS